jgi:hypothetical protein
MTSQERSDLERAISRASRAGLEVVGHGYRKGDNAHIYCVPSSTVPNLWHVVTQCGNRLVCDCLAGQRNRICVHRAATYVYLFTQARRRQQLADEVEQALREEREEQALHAATATLERAHRELDRKSASHQSPRLADDNRAVSMFR